MSLGTTTRSLLKNAKLRFPGARDADIAEFTRLQFSVSVDNPKVKDDALASLIDEALAKATEAGESWAVSLRNSYRDSIIKPIIEKAEAKGLDPVSAIVFNTDLDDDEARAMVKSLEDGPQTGDDAADDSGELEAGAEGTDGVSPEGYDSFHQPVSA